MICSTDRDFDLRSRHGLRLMKRSPVLGAATCVSRLKPETTVYPWRPSVCARMSSTLRIIAEVRCSDAPSGSSTVPKTKP